MPEGPEIWRTADALNDALKDKKISDIYFSYDKLKSYEKMLTGRKINGVEPRGKALLTKFDNGLVMYSHNQLYGKWLVREGGDEPDNGRKLRVAIHNAQHSAYLYSATDISILRREDVAEHAYIRKLGPDVLHPDTTLAEILRRLKDERFINRKVTTLLLDQGFLSGIGNYLRSEIMFYANVHPSMKLRECSEKQKALLAEAALKLSHRSYKTKGITNAPAIVEALKREGAGRSQYRHFVYGRTEDFCHKCGTRVKEVTTGGRKVYFCPTCQSTGKN